MDGIFGATAKQQHLVLPVWGWGMGGGRDPDDLETYSTVLKHKIPNMNPTACDLFFLLGEKGGKGLIHSSSQGGRSKPRKEEL